MACFKISCAPFSVSLRNYFCFAPKLERKRLNRGLRSSTRGEEEIGEKLWRQTLRIEWDLHCRHIAMVLSPPSSLVSLSCSFLHSSSYTTTPSLHYHRVTSNSSSTSSPSPRSTTTIAQHRHLHQSPPPPFNTVSSLVRRTTTIINTVVFTNHHHHHQHYFFTGSSYHHRHQPPSTPPSSALSSTANYFSAQLSFPSVGSRYLFTSAEGIDCRWVVQPGHATCLLAQSYTDGSLLTSVTVSIVHQDTWTSRVLQLRVTLMVLCWFLSQLSNCPTKPYHRSKS